MFPDRTFGGVLALTWHQMLQREIRLLGGTPECIDRTFQSQHKLTRLARFIIGLNEEVLGPPVDHPESRPFGRVQEITWYQMLEREIRLLGGTSTCLRRVFHGEDKLTQLAGFIITLGKETVSAPADRLEPRPTTPS
jgi:hypothetical protein